MHQASLSSLLSSSRAEGRLCPEVIGTVVVAQTWPAGDREPPMTPQDRPGRSSNRPNAPSTSAKSAIYSVSRPGGVLSIACQPASSKTHYRSSPSIIEVRRCIFFLNSIGKSDGTLREWVPNASILFLDRESGRERDEAAIDSLHDEITGCLILFYPTDPRWGIADPRKSGILVASMSSVGLVLPRCHSQSSTRPTDLMTALTSFALPCLDLHLHLQAFQYTNLIRPESGCQSSFDTRHAPPSTLNNSGDSFLRQLEGRVWCGRSLSNQYEIIHVVGHAPTLYRSSRM